MKISNWTVMKEKSNSSHYYFYGPLDEYEPEDLDGLEIIPYELWNAEDFAEILGNILEDRNHHWMTSIPRMLLNVLKSQHVEESNSIMRTFAENMENDYFN